MNSGLLGTPKAPPYQDYFFGGGDTRLVIPIYGRPGDRFDFDLEFQDLGGSATVGFQFNGDPVTTNYVYQTIAANGATVSGAVAAGVCAFASIDTLAQGSGHILVGASRITYESTILRVIPSSTLVWISYVGYWNRTPTLAALPTTGPLTLLTLQATAAMRKGSRFRLYRANSLGGRL